MIKLSNPFRKYEGYNCFGCSPDNQNGLQLTFIEEGEEITADWTPTITFQGYHNVLHGGIQATLLDEIASWVVYVKLRRSGVTSSMNIRYIKPVYIDQGAIKLVSKVIKVRRNLADIEAKLIGNNGDICAEGVITYFTFPEEKSKDSLYYPSYQEFYP